MIGIYDLPEGYICLRCGSVMEPREVCLSYDDTMQCKWCKSDDVVPAYKCSICDELKPEDEIAGHEHRVCLGCIEKKRYDLDFCAKVGEDEGTEVVLNGFLTEFFTESEINELMLTALKERANVNPVNGLKYLRYASGVAADLLYEEDNN